MTEFSPEVFKKMDQQRSEVSHVLGQREVLAGKIGKGDITPESSIDNAMKVGGARGSVKGSIERHRERISRIDQEFESRAPEYLALLRLKVDKLEKLKDLVDKGFLTQEEVQPHFDEYNSFASLQDKHAALRRGIEKMNEPQAEDNGDIKESSEGEALSEEIEYLRIPPVPALIHTETSNEHRYDKSITVGTKAKEAASTPENERTPEQKQLLDDVRVFGRYSLDESYKDVFTPQELHGLVEKFKVLHQKKRPDFDGVEGRIIDYLNMEIAQARRERRDDSEFDSILGIVKRADQDRDNRKGMNWDSMNKVATVASKKLEERINGKYAFGEYKVQVIDPRGSQSPNLRPVFQFVADDYALEVIGKRIDAVTGTRQNAYESNAAIINEWYKGAEEFIAQIPDDLRIKVGVTTANAKYQLRSLVQTMNTRLNSSAIAGHEKSYLAEPVGALNLQKRIAYTVDDINTLLSSPIQEEIIPLEV